MDLRHLRYFLCVAEEMHFGRAAKRLGISQPPLSQQIRALEDELGAQLFERTSRRVTLTEVGKKFEPEARATLAQARRAKETARLAMLGDIGHLALGVTASATFVPRIVHALHGFRQSHPHVEMALPEMGRAAQIEALERREIDMGMVRGFDRPMLPDGQVAILLVEEDMLLAMRDDHPIARLTSGPAVADLRGEPMVLYDPVNGAGFNDHFFARCDMEGFRPTVAQEVTSMASLIGLVAAGFGVTLLARSLTRLHVDNLVYHDLSPQVISRLWLIHRRDLSPTARALKQAMLADGDQA